MKKTKIYAVRRNYRTGEQTEALLGRAVLSDINTISAYKYNDLKRSAMKRLPLRKHEVLNIVTEDGKKDTFGGYPAETNVRFE
jgi:hypothetical protein